MTHRSIQDIKASYRLEEVVRHRGVMLRETASQERLEAVCPFHAGDTTPSFNVYLQSQQYHCFGCGAHGDVINFVQEFDLCTVQEAFEHLATDSIPFTTPQRNQIQEPRPALSIPLTLSEASSRQLTMVMEYYHQTLLTDPALKTWLQQERGITEAGIRLCRLGYADGSFAAKADLQDDDRQSLQKMGVLNAHDKERLCYRVVVPEVSDSGCSWLVGRQTRLSPGKRTPKYLGVSLPKPLLGYSLARQRLQQKELLRAIVVVEGALDYVIASQWALPIVPVALVGAHASRQQLALLLDLQQRMENVPIILSLDADEVGRQASSHLLSLLQQKTHAVLEMSPIAGAKDIGDLGTHAAGRVMLLDAVEAAVEQHARDL